MIADTPFKEVMSHLTRARSYVRKYEVLKALKSLGEAFGVLATVKLTGREKYEAERFAAEVVRGFSGLKESKPFFPSGVAYKPGQERVLHQAFVKVHDTVIKAIAKAEREKVRARKLALDRALLEGQRLLDEGQKLEAVLHLRKTAEAYEDERGVYFEAGNKLFKAGLVRESVEFFEEAIRRDPREPRAYLPLYIALESLVEYEKADAMLQDALRHFGSNDRTYCNMARLYVKMRRYGEAYDAAVAAQEVNPFSREAAKIIKLLEPKIMARKKSSS